MRLPHHRLVVLAGLSLLRPLTAQAEPLEEVQKLATEWARLRSETSRLEADWATEKTLLQASIQAMELRIASLEENRQVYLAATAKERNEQGDVSARNAEAAAALKTGDARLRELSAQLTELRPALPPRLSQALELPYKSLSRPDLSTGERMQLIMTLINRSIQFNRTITYSEEAVSLQGEKEDRLLRVLYWGLSQGYALDTATHKAYLGRPVGKAWQWELLPDSEKQVGELFAIYNEKADPSFVPVPAQISGLTTATKQEAR